jgi:tetratricopeptide (TPR) repeat protein
MKTHFKYLIAAWLFAPTILVGCAPKLTVKSDPPEASVFFRSYGTEDKKLIGKTPLSLSLSEVQNQTKINPSSGEFFELILEKKDFQTERVLVPGGRMGHIETTVLAKLKPGQAEGRLAQILLQHLFNAQKLANDREFERAQMEIDKALEIDPSFTRAMSLRGSILFVQQKYEDSLKWFEKALTADPQFEDAIKMISQIKKITGLPQMPGVGSREPGSTGGGN